MTRVCGELQLVTSRILKLTIHGLYRNFGSQLAPGIDLNLECPAYYYLQ